VPAKTTNNDSIAAIAEAFFIANLLFVGVFYLALWALYFIHYKKSSAVTRSHLIQTLAVSSITTALFITINITILLTTGYASAAGLLSLEVYFMLLLPAFLLGGIMGFTRAIKGTTFSFPLIGRYIPAPVSQHPTPK
jgi:hypothetical protein